MDEIAAGSGLHVNTVRAHLQVLEEAGLVVGSSERPGRPGRPRILFAAVPDTPEQENALLSAMLASALAPLPNGADLAIAAGRNWGHVLVERLEPGQQADEETCIARVAALLRSRGFAPETTARVLTLRRCPFRDLTDRYADVVCSLHAGLIDGALDELGAPVELEGIEHGTTASTACRARLRERLPAAGRGRMRPWIVVKAGTRRE